MTHSSDNLRTFLLNHEHDIADQLNDFGELLDPFYDFFNRMPKPTYPTITKHHTSAINSRYQDDNESPFINIPAKDFSKSELTKWRKAAA